MGVPGPALSVYRYIALHKPFEVLSQFTDEAGRSTLRSYIPLPGVYAAGRLDYRSEGLLLLSDDGAWIQRITDPRYAPPKIYYAQVEGQVDPAALAQAAGRLLVPGLQTRPAAIDLIAPPEVTPRAVRAYHPLTWLKVTLNEGKKHEVRRITAALGYPTLRLIRYAIGEITLAGLAPGEWRDLAPVELLNT